MLKIDFLGASGTVTGSSYLVTSESGSKILVDMGLFQESGWVTEFNFEELPFDAKALDGVLLTHAHLDHCGRLPLLAQAGFTRTIYATAATKDITSLSLIDAAGLAEDEKDHPPLFSVEDVEKITPHFVPVVYDKEFSVGNFLVTFHDAGHILGSSSISVTEKGTKKTIIFSGDLGNTPEDLIKPTEFFTSADAVVMESTYGEGEHVKEDAMGLLQKEINTIETTNGVLLIPAFSIERSQEILHRIGVLKSEGKILSQTPVFLDSPMAIEVTQIFEKYPDLYNKEMAKEKHPFNFENLTLTKSVDESKHIAKVEGAKVIIAGSGMMSGGRILHHLDDYLSLPTTRVLFVGYQAAHTLGRLILNGIKEITLYHHQIPIAATISKISSLSSHADQPKLINWLRQIKHVKKVFLTHGEDAQRIVLKESIQKTLGLQNILLPKKGESYEIE